VPQSIPPGLKTDHVLKALADLDAGAVHPFGEPTKYELVHEGKRYAPKAVIGLAYHYLSGRALQPDEFCGGEAPGQANYVLRRLGFTVVRKGEGPRSTVTRSTVNRGWPLGDVCRILRPRLSIQAAFRG